MGCSNFTIHLFELSGSKVAKNRNIDFTFALADMAQELIGDYSLDEDALERAAAVLDGIEVAMGHSC